MVEAPAGRRRADRMTLARRIAWAVVWAVLALASVVTYKGF